MAVFHKAVLDYHIVDSVNQPVHNPFEQGSFLALLYAKNWIDTVQWHLEDLIRNPHIEPVEALSLKRKIDRSNQDRTDIVERIEDWIIEDLKNVTPLPEARINSETPAWLLDRMSILGLKIYHMQEQAHRKDAPEAHRQQCQSRLSQLLGQEADMIRAFDELMEDLTKGIRIFKVYRQMKMYNDPSLNPVLYQHVQQL